MTGIYWADALVYVVVMAVGGWGVGTLARRLTRRPLRSKERP